MTGLPTASATALSGPACLLLPHTLRGGGGGGHTGGRAGPIWRDPGVTSVCGPNC